jgi:prepilin-type N-terminal cleavage/methylation domain-containing protein
MKKRTKGFTLIELLVVIAIIAILSTVVMTGLNNARAKGRDGKRLTDLKSLQKALDLYYDTCGGYPALGASGTYADIAAGAGNLNIDTFDGTCDSTQAFGTFMNPLPVNPQPNGSDYQYCSTDDSAAVGAASCDAATATSYQITFSIENSAGSLTTAGDYVLTPSGIQGPV